MAGFTRGALTVAATVLLAAGASWRAGADPATPGAPAPAPPPLAVPQPDSLPRDAYIGGARTSTNSGLGTGNGMGRPLAEPRERSVAAVPPVPSDGVHAATAWPGKQVVIHLPNERALTAANWGEGGAAAYGSPPVDYVVIPDAGGGADIRMIRKTFISPSDFTLGVRYPDGTHLRQAAQAVVVETDAAPGKPAAIIGALSIPEAKDGAGNPISVNPSIGGSYLYQQSDVNLNVGEVGLLNFPVTITVAYRPTTTVPAVTQGDPAPKPPAGQTSGGRCVSGPPQFRGADNDGTPGGSADFAGSCARLAACMSAAPVHTSALTCENTFMADLTNACVSAFGFDGDDYEGCLAAANGHTRWAKENMRPGTAAPGAGTCHVHLHSTFHNTISGKGSCR
ncbi:hypothetical protein [Mycobacteroides chelonae]|uniref:hypothetical protein n=1 Tax=Mycobacteroides chelonae TaxID=1774 RepID=UPI003AAF97F4